MNVSRMFGPGLAGVLITTIGVAGGYTIVTLCYALGYVLLLTAATVTWRAATL